MFKYQGIDQSINNALIFAAVQFVLTIVLMVIGFQNMWSVLDLILLVVCGIGIKKHSRVAAVTMLLFFIIGRVALIMEHGISATAAFMAILGLSVYGFAAQACFEYRKHHAHGKDDVMVY